MKPHSYSILPRLFSALTVSVCMTSCGFSINQGIKGLPAAVSDTPADVPVPTVVPVPVAVVPAAIPIGGDEPFRTTGQTLIWQDDFDTYKTFSDAVANGWHAMNGTTVQDTTSNPLGANRIISPGYDGTGKAIRLVYDGVENCGVGTGQECHSWSRMTGPDVGDTMAGMPGHTFYISYYFRMNPGPGLVLDNGVDDVYGPNKIRIKVKWLELWNHTDGNRAEFNNSYSTCTNGLPQTLWSFYGNSGGNTPCNAGQTKPPFAYQGANQWHRATHRYVTQSAPGAQDGVAQMWLDGTLILSVGKGYCDVPVPGAIGDFKGLGSVQPWCNTFDLDAMYVQDYVRRITLGSVQTNGMWPYSIDHDHMILWKD